ncbi:hypothetical protein [Rothia nasimurium]|nr:hypothetical protein [Rothia nasimurium]
MKKFMTDTYLKALLSLVAPLASQDDPERGDVPGWVMITMESWG